MGKNISANEITKRATESARKNARMTILSQLVGLIQTLDTQKDPSSEEEIAGYCEAYLTLLKEEKPEYWGPG
jgi:hypothetical protein